jgi:hypothetical protein
LAIYDKIIPYNKMGEIHVKSRYDVLQELAKQQGLENGELLDYLSGQPLDKSKSIDWHSSLKPEPKTELNRRTYSLIEEIGPQLCKLKNSIVNLMDKIMPDRQKQQQAQQQAELSQNPTKSNTQVKELLS